MSRLLTFLVFFLFGPFALIAIFAVGAVVFAVTMVFVWASLCWFAASTTNKRKTIAQVLSDWKNRSK